MSTRLSIVLLSWNSLPMLRRCLESLRELIGRADVQTIWIDNGSVDGSADYVAEHWPHIHSILLPENQGVAAGRNHGLRIARGQYILILDDDTESSPAVIDRMLSYMDAHPQCGIAGCALRDAEGHLQHSFKHYPGIRAKAANVLRARLGITKPVQLPQSVMHPCYVIGACQLIRREVIDRIGLLDEAIFYGPEDADFCIRARKAGYTIDYLPHLHILHHWRRITTRSLTSPASRRHLAGLRHFWRRHRRWL